MDVTLYAQIKICNVCNIEKSLDSFSSKKRGLFGRASRCKACDGEYHKQHRAANYEAMRAKEKAYKEANREKIREEERLRYSENKEKESLRKKKYRQDNPEHLSQLRKRRTNTPEYRLKNNAYERNKRKTDPLTRLARSLRTRLSSYCKINSIEKTFSAVNDVGCSLEELKKHIESQFEPWMSWSNHGVYNKEVRTWHLDHIIPLSRGKTSEEVLKLNHYSNLRPLEAIKNLKKNRF